MAHGGEFRTPSVQADRYGQFYVSWRSANGHDGEQDNDASYLSSTVEPTPSLYKGAVLTRTGVSNGGTDFKFEQYGGTSDQTATFNVTCYPMCGKATYGRHYTYRVYHHLHYKTSSGDSYCTVNLEPPNTKYFKSGCASYNARSFTDSLTAENLTGHGSTTAKKEVGVIAAFVDGLIIHIRQKHNSKDWGTISLAFTPDDDLTAPDGMYGQYNVVSAQSGKYYGVKGTLTGSNACLSVSIKIDAYYTFDGTTYTPTINKGSITVALTSSYHNSSTWAAYLIADDASSTSYYAYLIVPGYNKSVGVKSTSGGSGTVLELSTPKNPFFYYSPTFLYDDSVELTKKTGYWGYSSTACGIPCFAFTANATVLKQEGYATENKDFYIVLSGYAITHEAKKYDVVNSLGVVDGSEGGDSEQYPVELSCSGSGIIASSSEVPGTVSLHFTLKNSSYVSQDRTYRFEVLGLSAIVYVDITIAPTVLSEANIGRQQNFVPIIKVPFEAGMCSIANPAFCSLVFRENFIYAKLAEENPKSTASFSVADEIQTDEGKHFFLDVKLTPNARKVGSLYNNAGTFTHISEQGAILRRSGQVIKPSTRVVRGDTGEEVGFVVVSVSESGKSAVINVLPHSTSDMPDEGVFVLTTTGMPYFWIKPTRKYYLGGYYNRDDTPYTWKSEEEDEEGEEE